jgi:glutathione synthase/RimK-type ligase-like ATP-grasp enzyme
VEEKLASDGLPVFRLNTETFGTYIQGTFLIDRNDLRLALHAEGGSIDLKRVTSVWYRRPERPNYYGVIAGEEPRLFAEAEAKAFLDGLQACLKCRWLSRPGAIRDAGHKIEQLRVANSIGFQVPPTLVTQDPQAVREFRKKVDRHLVAKRIGRELYRAESLDKQYVVLTELLEDNVLQDNRALATCPAIYQPYVDKKFEVRVTVVGDEVFACRIDSQATERTRIDWRNYDLNNTPHSPYQLDSRHTKLCLTMVRHYGLNFGAIDLIVTPSCEVIFLEINPNGQWGWIEELTGLPIAAAHARFLSGA